MLKNIFNMQLIMAVVIIGLLTVVLSGIAKADVYTDYVNNLVTQLRTPNVDTRTIITDNFGFKITGKYVAGRKYRKFTADQKVRYLVAYKSYITNIYDAKLTRYANKNIKVINTKVYENGAIIVRSTVGKIKIDWRISIKSGSPKIIDVAVSGISIAMFQRAEFNTSIRMNGIEKFISLLESK